MRVKVISPTIQEFNGTRYYLCGSYFMNSSIVKRLHRVVWSYFNGEIPEGYDIHHKDEDRSNNQIENLEMLSASDHSYLHFSTDEARARSAEMGRKHQHLTKEWHASEEGRQWHKAHYEATKDKLHVKVEKICSYCNKEFTSIPTKGENCFCSKRCLAAHRRASGVDNVTAICPVCGATHEHNRYKPRVTCGRKCAAVYRKLTTE